MAGCIQLLLVLSIFSLSTSLNLVSNSLNTTFRKISNVPDVVSGGLAKTYNGTKEVAAEAYNTTKGAAVDAYNSTKVIAADAYNSTKGVAVDAYNSTKVIAADAYNSTKKAAVGAYNETKEIMKEIPKVVNKTVELVAEDTADSVNKTLEAVKTVVPFLNGSSLTDFTFTWTNGSGHVYSSASPTKPEQVDCLGLGKTVATALGLLFVAKANGSDALDVKFTFSSRKQPNRVSVTIGDQFGLEWTDFKIERRTVIIVHGFLSHGNQKWIADLEKAFLRWGDVNVIVVDWSAGGNTWNYYKAAVNTKIVGYQISQLLEHIANDTEVRRTSVDKWGPLHLVGHSLGAHICGFAAKELKSRNSTWPLERITGLDPAQPCFKNVASSVYLNKNDAPFIDIIHTNGKLLLNLGLGLPQPIGHADFYPNGGRVQPGCVKSESSFFDYLPIPKAVIEQTICSHGRSYIYLTESLISASNGNCSFWAHRWDLTYRSVLPILSEPCNKNVCSEMGINAEYYPQRGSFFAATESDAPYCTNGTSITEEVQRQLEIDHTDELFD
ncbi:phospholipase A1-like [Prorops nasuta]|uniref:phospholipase A1-like n=1 Tax=Prorops nasuta TaxID=863751 RepID=UPI0034CF75BF